MVLTPQVSSSPVAQLPASAGKAPSKQTGDGETFASLLNANGGDAAAAPGSPAGAAQIVGAHMQGRSSGKGQQATAAAQTSSGNPSGTAGTTQATEPQPQPQSQGYVRFPAVDPAFLTLSLRQQGSSGAVPVKQNAPAAGNAKASPASANAKSAKSENAPETAAPATPVNAAVAGSLAVLPAQIQAVPAPLGAPQTAAQTAPQTALQTAPQAGGNAAGAAAVADAQAASSKTAASAGFAQGAAAQVPPEGSSNPSAASQGQVASVAGHGQDASPAGALAAGKSSDSQSTPGVTVTEVRTHFAPQAQTATSQALQSTTTDTASALSADLGTVGAASGTGQGSQPVTPVENAASNRDRSGGQTSTPAPADKQAVQSTDAATAAAAAAGPSGQAAPSPMQQVFDAIQSAAPASAEGQPAAAPSTPSAPDGYQPLKTITIALQPDGLGTVAIQLSLKSSQLGVRVETSETSTAQLLRQHDSDLTELLQSAGYTVGSIAIQAAPQTAPADTAAQGGSSGQGASSMSDTGGGGSGGGSSAEGQAQRQPGSPNQQREGGGYGRPQTADTDRFRYI